MTLTPFVEALGSDWDRAAPEVRAHFTQPAGTRRYRGIMSRIWRREGWRGWLAGLFLKIGSWTEVLFAETGTDVPFELENVVAVSPEGKATMTWTRTFHFPGRTRRFDAIMQFQRRRGVLVDTLGRTRHLEVELHPEIRDRALSMRSGRQWLRIGRLRVPLPRWLAGEARVREWQEPNGQLGVRVTVSNPLLGEFFGYEGTFT